MTPRSGRGRTLFPNNMDNLLMNVANHCRRRIGPVAARNSFPKTQRLPNS
jgi:hypothetical protein